MIKKSTLFRVMAIGLGVLGAWSAGAVPPQASFDRLRTTSTGDFELHFTLGGNDKVITDTDGFATLATLQYLLIQHPSEALYMGNQNWEQIRTQPVKNWALVKSPILAALRKLEGYYSLKRATDADMVLAFNQLNFLVFDFDEYSGDRVPIYAKLNELGTWLEENSRRHRYEGLSFTPYNQSALGQALTGRGFTLPPQFVSRSRVVFEVDWAKAIETPPAAVAAVAPAPTTTRLLLDFDYGNQIVRSKLLILSNGLIMREDLLYGQATYLPDQKLTPEQTAKLIAKIDSLVTLEAKNKPGTETSLGSMSGTLLVMPTGGVMNLVNIVRAQPPAPGAHDTISYIPGVDARSVLELANSFVTHKMPADCVDVLTPVK